MRTSLHDERRPRVEKALCWRRSAPTRFWDGGTCLSRRHYSVMFNVSITLLVAQLVPNAIGKAIELRGQDAILAAIDVAV